MNEINKEQDRLIREFVREIVGCLCQLDPEDHIKVIENKDKIIDFIQENREL